MPDRVLLEAHHPRLFDVVLKLIPRRDARRVILHEVFHFADDAVARFAVGKFPDFFVAVVEFA